MLAVTICNLLSLVMAGTAFGQEALPTVAEADKIEADNALPITPFYDTPETMAAAKPGDLLRQEAFDGYSLPAGIKAVRFLYRSQGTDKEPVATSGVVLLPQGTPPAGGWPIIAWGHGTSGVARQCAPSLMKDVYYGKDLLNLMKGGFAIVATDYHGLGTEGPHRYIDKTAQAYDIIYSIPAARAAAPELGKEWVVNGHSQGGLAAWAVAEMQVDLKDPDYKGAVAVAGASNLARVLAKPEELSGAGFYFAWVAYAVHARFEDYQPGKLLSDAAMTKYQSVTDKGCWLHGLATYGPVEDKDMVKEDWNRNELLAKFMTENSAGDRPIEGPILVIAGEADRTISLAGVKESVAKACANKVSVTFQSYPGLDHDPTMSDTIGDQIAWIKDRFAGKPASGNCPK